LPTHTHFFELTEARPLVAEVQRAAVKSIEGGATFAPCTFLPAPKTWIEWRVNDGQRFAVHLEQCSSPVCKLKSAHAHATVIHATPGGFGTGSAGGIEFESGRVYL